MLFSESAMPLPPLSCNTISKKIDSMHNEVYVVATAFWKWVPNLATFIANRLDNKHFMGTTVHWLDKDLVSESAKLDDHSITPMHDCPYTR